VDADPTVQGNFKTCSKPGTQLKNASCHYMGTDYMTLLDEMAFKKNCCRINTSDDLLFFI
jgi:hypothetical protein